MKTVIITLLFNLTCLLTIPFSYGQGNSFESTDINGIWKCNKPGKEITLEIYNGVGTIMSVAGTSIPADLVKGNLYESITFVNGTWKAVRNKWIYPGVDGQNAEKGHWEKGNDVIMTLNDKKTELNVIGHWTYTKVKSETNALILHPEIIGLNEDNSNVLIEEYGELKAIYKFVKSGNREAVIAKLTNRSTVKKIALSVKNHKGVMTYMINKGETLTLNIEGSAFEIQMGYKESDIEEDSDYLMNLIKEGVRKIVVDEKGVPTSKPTVSFGIRG